MADRLTIPQAATRLGVSSRRVRALVTAGRLTVVEREETPRGPINWLAAAEVDALIRQPVGYPKGRHRARTTSGERTAEGECGETGS